MDISRPFLLTEATPGYEQILSSIVYLHAHCIMHDHTMATFLPPLTNNTMLTWWREQMAQVTATHRHVIVQLMPITSRTENIAPPVFTDVAAGTDSPVIILPGAANEPGDGAGKIGYEVAGVVSVYKPVTQTGSFRGTVEKLFTSPNHRRKGIARAVMTKLEEAALKDGRWSLLLDTTVTTPAEQVYPRLGYHRLGVVPEYGYNPKDGRLMDEVWFWKDLRHSSLFEKPRQP